jgi:hypothetical protein
MAMYNAFYRNRPNGPGMRATHLSVDAFEHIGDITIKFSQHQFQRLMIYDGPFLVPRITRYPEVDRKRRSRKNTAHFRIE